MVNQELIPIQQPTPFVSCIDINNLLNIISNSQSDSISRMKLQVDGGKDCLKMSVNIISMHPKSLYTPTPNSVLSNFVVAMGNAPENYHNLRELFNYSSIRKLFEIDIPIQIACDFKVAALLVGIQQASSNFPCPFCLWCNGSLCTGIPDKARKHQDIMVDLVKKCHNVINKPIISWSESPMEKIALAPLHILLGLVNRLYNEVRPSDRASSRRDRQLYKHHCSALCRYKVYRSEYWNATLDGNSCSRLLDHLDDIPFADSSVKFLNALKTLKRVKDNCLGKVRKIGWRGSIQEFRGAWRDAILPWSLKSHILSDHYEEYFDHFESKPDAGAAISSEQSGEMLHSRIQQVWNLRFKAGRDNPVYPQRLVDCIVTYNYNLQWGKVTRLTTKVELGNNKEGENDEDSDDEEGLVPHNWETESESSDSD